MWMWHICICTWWFYRRKTSGGLYQIRSPRVVGLESWQMSIQTLDGWGGHFFRSQMLERPGWSCVMDQVDIFQGLEWVWLKGGIQLSLQSSPGQWASIGQCPNTNFSPLGYLSASKICMNLGNVNFNLLLNFCETGPNSRGAILLSMPENGVKNSVSLETDLFLLDLL